MGTKNKQATHVATAATPDCTAAPSAYHAYTWAIKEPTAKDSWEWATLAELLDEASAAAPATSAEHRVLTRASADCRRRAGL